MALLFGEVCLMRRVLSATSSALLYTNVSFLAEISVKIHEFPRYGPSSSQLKPLPYGYGSIVEKDFTF